MKKILLIIGVLIVSLAYAQSEDYYHDAEINEFEDFINEWCIDDSVCELIRGREFLYFNRQRLWIIAIPDGDECHIVARRSMPPHDIYVDTIRKNPILTWGFDSLAINSKGLIPCKSGKTSLFTDYVLLFSSDGNIIFDNGGFDNYTGPNSEVFKKNLVRFTFYLVWDVCIKPHGFPEPETSVVTRRK